MKAKTEDEINANLGEIAKALGYNQWPLIRRIALTVVTRQMWELHRYGYFMRGAESLARICRRFRLGNYREASRQYLNNI
jgi:hypothetical protein